MDISFQNTKRESDLKNSGDMDKQVPMKPVEQIVTNKPIDNAVDVTDVKFVAQKTADMYHGVLFTVVPVDTDLEQDITPDVQGFEKRRVFLWDDYNSLFKFDETIWMKLAVRVDKDLVGKKVFKETGDAYSMEVIPVGWAKEQKMSPRYVE